LSCPSDWSKHGDSTTTNCKQKKNTIKPFRTESIVAITKIITLILCYLVWYKSELCWRVIQNVPIWSLSVEYK